MLNLQQGFRCGHSGACCTFGWHIPVESATHARVADAVRKGHLLSGNRTVAPDEAWIDMEHPPDGAVGVLKSRADGACVFFDQEGGRLCAIQRALGHDALPSACQQFPRVSVLDDRGAHVVLSHYCPSVAALLIEDAERAVEIVHLADGDPARRPVEGFDARAAVPPFLRPGVAFDLPAYGVWERGVVHALGRPDGDPDATLAAVALAAEGLRGWRPSRGPLAAEVEHALGAMADPPAGRGDPQACDPVIARLFETVAASVPAGLPRPALPPAWMAADADWVAPVWAKLSVPVGRFLSAKAFASSIAWQGRGRARPGDGIGVGARRPADRSRAFGWDGAPGVRRRHDRRGGLCRGCLARAPLRPASACPSLDRHRGPAAGRLPRRPRARRAAVSAGPGGLAPPSAPRQRIALLINQAARHGRGHLRIEHAIAELDRRSALTVFSPESDDATERIARACAGTHDIVVSAGGDGTAHQVLNGLAHTGTPMGLLPIGTGNDFARAFGIPRDPLRAAAGVLEGTPTPVDLIEVNGRFFGTVGVLGIGADSAIAVSRWMSASGARGAVARRLGGWTYRLAGLRQLLTLRAKTVSLAITTGGEVPAHARALHAVFVTNTAWLGGGLRLPVESSSDDGRLEVCVVPRIGRVRLLLAFLCFSQGWRIPDGVLFVAPGSTAEIVAPAPVTFCADGESMCTDRRFTLVAHRHALRVIC